MKLIDSNGTEVIIGSAHRDNLNGVDCVEYIFGKFWYEFALLPFTEYTLTEWKAG